MNDTNDTKYKTTNLTNDQHTKLCKVMSELGLEYRDELACECEDEIIIIVDQMLASVGCLKRVCSCTAEPTFDDGDLITVETVLGNVYGALFSCDIDDETGMPKISEMDLSWDVAFYIELCDPCEDVAMIDMNAPESQKHLDDLLATMTKDQLLRLKAQVLADESDNQFHLICFEKHLDIEPSRS